MAKQVFNINSTFDPDQTGVGHQPMYRDTYAGIYDHYAVISAKIKATFTSLAATTSMAIGCVFDDDSTTSSTLTTLLEQNNGKSLMLPPLTGALSNRVINSSWDCVKFLNIDPYTSGDYKAVVGSNPSEISTLLCWSTPIDGASTATVQLMIEIEQIVLWSELSTPSQN